MRLLSKTFACVAAVAVAALLYPVAANANADAPVLNSFRMESPTTMYTGETVKISFSASDSSGISRIQFEYLDSAHNRQYVAADKQSTGIATAVIGSAPDWPSGQYALDRIRVQDNNTDSKGKSSPNETLYERPTSSGGNVITSTGTGPTSHSFKFSDADFSLVAGSRPPAGQGNATGGNGSGQSVSGSKSASGTGSAPGAIGQPVAGGQGAGGASPGAGLVLETPVPGGATQNGSGLSAGQTKSLAGAKSVTSQSNSTPMLLLIIFVLVALAGAAIVILRRRQTAPAVAAGDGYQDFDAIAPTQWEPTQNEATTPMYQAPAEPEWVTPAVDQPAAETYQAPPEPAWSAPAVDQPAAETYHAPAEPEPLWGESVPDATYQPTPEPAWSAPAVDQPAAEPYQAPPEPEPEPLWGESVPDAPATEQDLLRGSNPRPPD